MIVIAVVAVCYDDGCDESIYCVFIVATAFPLVAVADIRAFCLLRLYNSAPGMCLFIAPFSVSHGLYVFVCVQRMDISVFSVRPVARLFLVFRRTPERSSTTCVRIVSSALSRVIRAISQVPGLSIGYSEITEIVVYLLDKSLSMDIRFRFRQDPVATRYWQALLAAYLKFSTW
jgi:hypothetical protein